MTFINRITVKGAFALLFLICVMHCFAYYGIARESCITKVTCEGECLSVRYSVSPNRRALEHIIFMSPLGGFTSGLGFGLCGIPFIPYPVLVPGFRELHIQFYTRNKESTLREIQFRRPYTSNFYGSSIQHYHGFTLEPRLGPSESFILHPEPDEPIRDLEGDIVGFEEIVFVYHDGSEQKILNARIHIETHYALYLEHYRDPFTINASNAVKDYVGGCPHP